MGRVVAFIRRSVSRDWSSHELAEFYRVEAALVRAGLRICSDRGLSDEGDPWFVFCREDDQEVIVHLARIGGRYLISAPSFGCDVSGSDFRTLVRELLERQPIVQPPRRGENISWHPAALLVALVAGAVFKATQAAEAATVSPASSTAAGALGSASAAGSDPAGPHAMDVVSDVAQQNAVILTAVALLADLAIPLPAATGAIGPAVAFAADLAAPMYAPALFAESLDTNFPAGTASMGSWISPPKNVAPLPSPSASVMALAHDNTLWHVQTDSGAGASMILADQGAVTASTATLSGSDVALPSAVVPAVPETAAILLSGAHDTAETVVATVGVNQPIIFATSLPAALVFPLHGRVHPTAISSPTMVSEPSPPHLAATTSSSTVSTPAAAHTDTAVPSNGTATGVVAEAPASGTMSSSAATPSLADAGAPNLSVVLAAAQQFAAEVGSHLAVLILPNQVIEYDYYAIDHSPAAVSAVTYDFADGSHLSLVGLPAELPHTQT